MPSPASIPPIAALHWVKPPRQARSQKTLERVLDAAEELIAERGVNAVTVAEVVKRAGSSVGAFYARFPDKDALLSTLHERSCDEALATAELALDPIRWTNRDLATAVSEIVRFTVQLCRERRGMLLAFIALAAADAAYAERRGKLETEIAARLHVFLSHREGEFSHHDPKMASLVAIRMLLGAAEYGALIQRAGGRDAELTDDRVGVELARAVLAYLGAAVSSGRPTA